MGTRELVKSGKLSVDDALTNFKELRNKGEFVGDNIIRWLQRHKGIHVSTTAPMKPRKNKQRKNTNGGHPAG